MSLRMVLGRVGSGKTSVCLSEIAHAQTLSDSHGLLYIVPEQFSLQSEKALLAATAGGVLTRAETLSFQRLAYRVFAELGGLGKTVLEDIGRNIVLRKILFDVKQELLYFTGAIDKQGFIERLARMIEECYQYEITAEALFRAAENVTGDMGLRLKLHDVAVVLTAYRAYLAENALSGDDTLDVLAGCVSRSTLVCGAEIWFDGFKGFTPQEYRVLEKLLQCASRVTISLTVDHAQNDYHGLLRQDSYFDTKNTVNVLRLMAESGRTPIEEMIDTAKHGRSRYENAPPLAFLERSYIGYDAARYMCDAAAHIRIVQADNMAAELHDAARTIVELTRERQCKYNEIGIICGALETYAKNLQSVFSQYDIPVYVDTKDDVMSHPLVECIRSAFSVIAEGWQYEGVFRLLKTGMTGIARAEVDRLENYVLAYGIRYGRWLKEWEYGFDGAYEGFGCEEMNGLRVRVLALMSPLAGIFTRSGRYTAAELCRGLYTFLTTSGVLSVLEQWIDDARDAGDNLLRQTHTLVWDGIAELLDKTHDTLGSEKMTVAAFSRILEAGFAAIKLGLVPPSLDQVMVGDVRRSRLSDMKAVLLLGANEGSLLGASALSGIFSDEDRRNLVNEGVQLAPDSFARAVEDYFNVYTVLTKPSMFLYVSCCMSTSEGKALFPSSVLQRLEELFPMVDRRRIGMETERISDIAAAVPTFDALAVALRRYLDTGEMSALYKDIYACFREDEAFRDELAKLEAQLRRTRTPEKLMRETVAQLYAGKVLSSVTQLEKYVQCPFSYYLRYNVHATERKVYEVESLQLGTIFHAALERYAKCLAERGVSWSDTDDPLLAALAAECVDAALAEQGNEIMQSTGQYRYFAERIKNISVQSIRALSAHMRGSRFEVTQVEASFGDALDAIHVPLVQGEMLLQGRIDRVDTLRLADGEYVKIVDYKSGRKDFSLSEVYYGLQMQLVLYIDAYIKRLKEQTGTDRFYPAAALYFKLQNPVIAAEEAIGEEELRQRLMAEFKMSGVVLNAREIIRNLDERLQAGSNGVTSAVVPVTLKKASDNEDFTLGSASRVVTTEEFGHLTSFVMQKAEEIGNQILGGDIAVWPCLYKKETGCRFCAYKAICGFEAERGAFRYMKPMSETEAKENISKSQNENA